MGKTKIEWCDYSFNPWWGCIKVSPGCEHCYMYAWVKRMGYGSTKPAITGPAKTTERRLFRPAHWAQPLAWDKAAQAAGVRERVFCASMGDVFEEHAQLVQERHQLWCLIDSTPNLDWLVLTKRPQNVMDMVPSHWRDRFPSNVWLGVSVEDQQRAEERIPILLNIPAQLRFLSCEPLLERITLDPWVRSGRLHWVIVGGESGGQARPFSTWWARRMATQCLFAGVPYFVKELGSNPQDSSGRSIKLHDYKGADWDEWPEDLRVRRYPVSPAVSESAVQRNRNTVQRSVATAGVDVNKIVYGAE